MNAIILWKAKKKYKNAWFFRHKVKNFKLKYFFQAGHMESYISETNIFFKNIPKTRWPPYLNAKE